ncbi:SMC-Scp complex subunit ScpB [Micromonospora sp. CPCC 205371]|nr:SMC-Scp complex subunit ScpB [Micromonospora sp. CPCC 205371]
MSDERPESLAEQAAGWVPPWARPDYVPPSARPAELEPATDTETASPPAEDAPGSDGEQAQSVVPEVDAGSEVAGAVPAEEAPAADGEQARSASDGEILEGYGGNGAITRQDSLPGDRGSASDARRESPSSAADGAEAEAEIVEGASLGGEVEPGVDGEIASVARADGEVAAVAPVDAGGGVGPAPSAEAAEATAEAAGAEGGAEAAGDAGAAAAGLADAAAVGAEAKAPDHALALIDDAELRGALEAVLLVVDEPVSEIVLAQVLEQPTERIAAMLTRIAEDYTSAGHGFELRRAAGGWRLYTRPAYAPYVERFVLDGQSVRLTQAALETLAVVAYKQPVTRSRISAIRGVNCDGVIRTLVSRGLVEECGTEPETGAHLYRTTVLFLEKLGLNTVDELPPLAPFLPDDVDEFADAQ